VFSYCRKKAVLTNFIRTIAPILLQTLQFLWWGRKSIFCPWAQ